MSWQRAEPPWFMKQPNVFVMMAQYCLLVFMVHKTEHKVTLVFTCRMLETINLSHPQPPPSLWGPNLLQFICCWSGTWGGKEAHKMVSASPSLTVTTPSSCTQFKGHVPLGDASPLYLSPCCSSGNRCLIQCGPFPGLYKIYIYLFHSILLMASRCKLSCSVLWQAFSECLTGLPGPSEMPPTQGMERKWCVRVTVPVFESVSISFTLQELSRLRTLTFLHGSLILYLCCVFFLEGSLWAIWCMDFYYFWNVYYF